MKKIFLIIFFLSFCASARANDDHHLDLMKQYLRALRSRDRLTINAAWNKIDLRPETKKYIQKKWPKVFISYEMWALSIRLQALSQRQPGSAITQDVSEPIKSSKRRFTSRDLTRHYPNQRRISNSRLSRRKGKPQRSSNQRIARHNSNQKRESNQRLIRKRRR